MQPLKSLATAWWLQLQPTKSLEAAVSYAKKLVLEETGTNWGKVTGPVAAAVASASRIGWTFRDGHTICCENGSMLDLLLDPPAVFAAATKRAVRAWRLQRIGAEMPGLIPDHADINLGHGGTTHTVDLIDVPGKLLATRHRFVKEFSMWGANHKPSLRSAMVGGQWPQIRIAKVPEW